MNMGQGSDVQHSVLPIVLVPRLCLGTPCLAGSAGRVRGGASRATGYEAEPRNQGVPGVWDPRRCSRPRAGNSVLRACLLALCGWLAASGGQACDG